MIEVREIEFFAGTNITHALNTAKEFAIIHNCIVKFNFNGVSFNISSYSDIDYQLDKYHEEMTPKKKKNFIVRLLNIIKKI